VTGPEYDGIMSAPVFSPDGTRLAYIAKVDKKRLVVVDGVSGPQYDGIGRGDPVFSPDGRRVAYVAMNGGGQKEFVVVDGVSGAEYDEIAGNSPVFSPDGMRFAYIANKGRTQVVVVDRKPGPEFAAIAGGPVFHGDGTLEYLGMRYSGLYRVKHRF
jgi:Tol biopolymer transport system component